MRLPIITALLVTFSAAPISAEEITYRQHIKPLWTEKCLACHGPHTPYIEEFDLAKDKYSKMSQGPRMDSYSSLIDFVGWPDNGALMRRLDDGKNSGGKAGNMYEKLGTDEAERQKNLALFKAWVGEDAWNLNRWNAKGNVPAITKEQMDKIKVAY